VDTGSSLRFDRLAAIVESSTDAIVTKTLDGMITSWNRAAIRIFGYEAGEAIGRHITMLFPPERVGEEAELLARVARDERVEHFETQRVRKDRTRIDVSISLSPVRDAEGRIVEIAKIVRDLTVRRRFEAQAQDAADAIQTMHAFLESTAEGVVVVNAAGQIVRVNPQTERVFGYTEQELLGRPVDSLLPERFRAAHHEHRAHYFAGPRSRSMGLGLDLFGLRKDGREVPVEISLSSIPTDAGPLALALITEISERRRLERAARQHEKLAALATLSAGIAHELNNPIGIIATRIDVMLEDAKSQPLPIEVAEDLHVLRRNIERVIRIAKGLLSFARQAPDAPVLVDLNAVIEETLLLVGKQLGNDGVQVSVMLDRTIGPVRGSGNELQQVLTNLLLNARDAMPHGGCVEIRTEADREAWVGLTIADTGEGMPAEAVAKIWEPFYTTKQFGTGLGLSVSHKIIREHGGTVSVNSSLGNGTTFTIALPVHPTTH
jgi:PAS domain S-box-containing protein